MRSRSEATARSVLRFPPDVFQRLFSASVPAPDGRGAAQMREIMSPKGATFATASVAAVMAAKKTSELIPFCHALPIDQVGTHRRHEEGRCNASLLPLAQSCVRAYVRACVRVCVCVYAHVLACICHR